MITEAIPETNPLDLLYNPYRPVSKEDLATMLGVTDHTVESWLKQRRNPSRTAKILAAMILNQWKSDPQTA